MYVHRLKIMLFASLTLVLGCSKSDREQAAKTEDGVASFRYQPGDKAKYREKKEAKSQQSPSDSSTKSAASTSVQSTPKASEK